MAMAMATPMGMDQPAVFAMERERPTVTAHAAVVMPEDFANDEYVMRMREEDSSCAQLGCLLSLFIPVAGWITAYYNIGAPAGSRRRKYGMCFDLYSVSYPLRFSFLQQSCPLSLLACLS